MASVVNNSCGDSGSIWCVCEDESVTVNQTLFLEMRYRNNLASQNMIVETTLGGGWVEKEWMTRIFSVYFLPLPLYFFPLSFLPFVGCERTWTFWHTLQGRAVGPVGPMKQMASRDIEKRAKSWGWNKERKAKLPLMTWWPSPFHLRTTPFRVLRL